MPLKTINSRVKQIRTDLKLSQREFSKSLGISQAALSDIERGVNGLSLETFRNIVNSYHVDAYWLLDGGDDQNIFRQAERIQSFQVSKDLESLLQDLLSRVEALEKSGQNS